MDLSVTVWIARGEGGLQPHPPQPRRQVYVKSRTINVATIATPMWDAFFSHASQDMAAALRLEQSLSAKSLSAWVDHDNIRGGGLLIPARQAALQDSRNIVILWSKAAAVSAWVTTEWTSIVNFNHQKDTRTQKGVIPCRSDDEPLALFLLNYVFCDFRTSFDDGAARLARRFAGRSKKRRRRRRTSRRPSCRRSSRARMTS
jgi:TIR domain-containing protein